MGVEIWIGRDCRNSVEWDIRGGCIIVEGWNELFFSFGGGWGSGEDDDDDEDEVWFLLFIWFLVDWWVGGCVDGMRYV